RAVAVSKLPFDRPLFTVATSVGLNVMRAAAYILTSVTLVLSGKSPANVSDSLSMKVAAERIVFGKSLNAGQTCVAPDYVLVDYTAIINERQLGRLRG
ncbi:aldehyde dehydrogenase family protein, partial [Pseudomonas aeruginosa]